MSDASTLFEMITSDHRRRILLLLCQTESLDVPTDLRSRGQNTTHQSRSNQLHYRADTPDSQMLTLELIHTHLPKLEAKGFIEWDPETQTITKGPRFPEIEPALTVLLSNTEKFPADLL